VDHASKLLCKSVLELQGNAQWGNWTCIAVGSAVNCMKNFVVSDKTLKWLEIRVW